MNKAIINTEIQEFINKNLNSDVLALTLKGTNYFSVTTIEIIEQIEAKKRCEKKLPTWYNTQNIYYANKLNIEQTSSEITAKYKSKIINGNAFIDLTGGFGVDSYYFSKQFNSVEHCEIDKNLSEIVKYNFKQLKIKNINALNIDGIEHLTHCTLNYDLIYLDPSRRHESKGKVFFLKDCIPNVTTHLDLLFSRSKNIMIKTSPLLDLTIGIGELKYVKAIHVVAVNNEVKELLWILENKFNGGIQIETVNLKKEKNDHFKFSLENEKNTQSNYNLPLTYLYEPNSAILKSGGFDSISKELKVFKLHKHSHLYTSDSLVDFPGRTFNIENISPFNKKELKKLTNTKANITTRNFPESVQRIRKKFKIKDGGNSYMFFTTNMNSEKIMIKASKVS